MSMFISKNRAKIIISMMIIIVAIIFLRGNDKSEGNESTTSGEKITAVEVKKISDMKTAENKLEFSGTVVGDQEIRIFSQTNGIVKSVNFDLGDWVSEGKVLAIIDDQGSFLSEGKNNFKSTQIQQAELNLRQTKEAYDLAKRKYDDEKNNENKTARDVAKLQYESAKLGLNSSLNANTITTPISGAVIDRQISVGDFVSAGQLLATISKTNSKKINFYVSSDEIKNISSETAIEVRQGSENIKAKIKNISPQADKTTRKFLVEAIPEKNAGLLLGTIIDVLVKISNPTSDGKIYIPLSTINSSQTENYIFIFENGKAKKVPILIENIFGETATIKSDLPDETQIITEGNKIISDGEEIRTK